MVETTRILVVDDDRLDAAHLSRLIPKTGLPVEIEAVHTADEARKALLDPGLSLVFVDHFLGSCTGPQLIADGIAAGSAASFIALTGLADEALEDRALEAGAVDFIPKPDLSVSVLKRAIRCAVARAASRRQVEIMARTDDLTGAWNRAHLTAAMEHAVARSRRSHHPLGVLYMDLNGFKPINDTYGHAAGDALLKAFTARLQGLMRESDLVARVGGDEFVVLLDSMTGIEDGTHAVDRLSQALPEPYEVNGRFVRVGVSIGLSTFPKDATSVDQLLAIADRRMMESKRLTGAHRRVTIPAGSNALSDAQADELQRAAADLSAEPRFAPRRSLQDGSVVAIVASLGGPDTDLEGDNSAMLLELLAAHGRLDAALSAFTDAACASAARWRQAGITTPLALNLVGASDLAHVVATTRRSVVQAGLDEGAVELWLSAPTSLHDVPPWLGPIVFDAASVGLGALSAHAGPLPFSGLCISSSLIGRLGASETAGAAVHAIVALCAAVGVPAIAYDPGGRTDDRVLADLGITCVSRAAGKEAKRRLLVA